MHLILVLNVETDGTCYSLHLKPRDMKSHTKRIALSVPFLQRRLRGGACTSPLTSPLYFFFADL